MKLSKLRNIFSSGASYNGGIRSESEIAGWMLKIFLASLSSIIIGQLINLIDVLTLAFVTLLCLQPTVIAGVRVGIQQLITAVFCSALTIAFLKIAPNLFAAPVSIVLVSIILIKSKNENLLPIAFFSVLYIGAGGKDNPEFFFIERIKHLFIGIPIAAVLNYFFGIYDYKNKLLKRILNLRSLAFRESADLLRILVMKDAAKIENKLNEFRDFYFQIENTVLAIKDIESEYKTFLSFLIKKIKDIEIYRFYLWNLHDLIQNCHNLSTLHFKINIAPEFNEYFLKIADFLEKYEQKYQRSNIADLIPVSNEYCQSEKKAMITGILFGINLHIKQIQKYESEFYFL
ncbi:MAG TPA: aromatic acid exporter family protein [bacterium]|nr:aromatic acid exporter family protein [bacterium]HPN31076.1 aromatic acid exporter family protein [bacterium]